MLSLTNGKEINFPYSSPRSYSTMVHVSKSELQEWRDAYTKDTHFSLVVKSKKEGGESDLMFAQYHYSESGLVYFEGSMGNTWLCIPKDLRVEVMQEAHNTITEAAHRGYFKTYNQISTTYYWPRMSREIKIFVNMCDVCQKTKPRWHGPMGLLQPIPIPTQPFEVVSMNFIPKLPFSNGFDNILVIVDKLTKYAIIIPMTTKITEEETTKLFFKHIISKFRILRQVISDRDTRWRGNFWKEICRLMGMRRALMMSYHLQADGQTEILNQGLKISIHAYISPDRDDWSKMLDALSLSYNASPHTATGFSPAYLLRGFQPITSTTIIGPSASIDRAEVLSSGDLARQSVEFSRRIHRRKGEGQGCTMLRTNFSEKGLQQGET